MNHTPYPAPDFSLVNSLGQAVSLDDFKGKWLVVYFYPKNDTPGCTVEACSMRDARDDLADLGVEVVGISRDDPASHEKFKAKHSLNFTLLSDPTAEAIKRYGAWGSSLLGRPGTQRKTYIINPDGQIVKVYDKVTPVGHGEQLVEDVKRLQSA